MCVAWLPRLSDGRTNRESAAVSHHQLARGAGVRGGIPRVITLDGDFVASLDRSRPEAAANQRARRARLERPLLDFPVAPGDVEKEPRMRVLETHRRDRAF